MRYYILIILVIFPIPAFAACSPDGATVVYINGIFTNLDDAKKDLRSLQTDFYKLDNDRNIKFINGYNPSHLAGVGDLVQSALQTFFSSASDFDRDAILLQIYPEVTTRKLVLVGHSQGSFYSNSIYDYLLNHGEPKGSVGVYNVASPASYTAGGGLYLTANQDTVIKWAYDMTKASGGMQPLAPNTDLPLTIEQALEKHPGHSFAGYYLQNSGSRIAGDLQFELNMLRAELPLDAGGCFPPPANGLGYKTKQVLFAVADPAATGIKVAAVTGFKGTAIVFNTVTSGLAAAGSFFGSVAGTAVPTPRTTNLPGSHSVVGALYGSSVKEKNLKEFGLLNEQGGAVVLAVYKPAPLKQINTREVQCAQTEEPDPPAPQESLIQQPKGAALS